MMTHQSRDRGPSPQLVLLLLAAIVQSSVLADPSQFVRPPATVEQETVRLGMASRWSEIAAKTKTHYSGDGLSLSIAPGGAIQIRCVFQNLQGEITDAGLWLTSTAPDQPPDQFQIVADFLGREGGGMIALPDRGETGVSGERGRYERPGLVEEYSVSMEGVRQDFLVTERPEGSAELVVELALTGARAEVDDSGLRLRLERSGRKLAYSGLRVWDASQRELKARFRLISPERLAIAVDDEMATYPVRIDPTVSDDDWLSMAGLGGQFPNVLAAVVDEEGTLYVGGSFTSAGGVYVRHVAMWDGQSWSGLGGGIGSPVFALALLNGDLYAGGYFQEAGGRLAKCVAKWDGTTWSPLGSGIPGEPLQALDGTVVNALAVANGELYAGGSFTLEGGAKGIAKWDGTSWSAVGSGLGSEVPGQGCTALALAASGNDLYVAGDFWWAGEVEAHHIARWDAQNGTWSGLGSNPGSELDGVPYALAISPSGELYAGGFLTWAGSVELHNIARWDGTAWSSVGGGVNGVVYALTATDTDLYVGGDFTQAGEVSANRVAQWGWAEQRWHALGSGVNAPVRALALSSADLFVGGEFTIAGGKSTTQIARARLLPNNPPTASDVTYERPPDYKYKIWIPELLAHSFDPDNDALTISGLGEPDEEDAFVRLGDEYILYHQDNNDPDSFSYTISDGCGGTDTATITLGVKPAVGGYPRAGLAMSHGVVSVKFFGLPHIRYDVYRRSNLNEPWIKLNGDPLPPGADGSFVFEDASPPAEMGFYITRKH
ncbi:MAG: cadherin-like domain-containing protein [Verrucomicrobiia bacterium]